MFFPEVKIRMRIIVNIMGKALKSQYRRIMRSNQKIKNYFNGVMSWVHKRSSHA